MEQTGNTLITRYLMDELQEAIKRKRAELEKQKETEIKHLNISIQEPSEWYKCPCGKEVAKLTEDGICWDCQQKKLNETVNKQNDWKTPIIEALKNCLVMKFDDLSINKVLLVAERYHKEIDIIKVIRRSDEWLATVPKRYKNYARFIVDKFQRELKYVQNQKSINDFRGMYEKEERIRKDIDN